MAKKDPPMTEARISYSYGAKMNLGNYESADIHLSRAETFDVTGMSDEEIADFMQERHDLLKEDVDEKVMDEYYNNSTQAGKK